MKTKIGKDFSYFIGLAQTDGHLRKHTRNRGRFTIELQYRDRDIIYNIAKLISYNYMIFSRTRDNIKLNGRTYNNKRYIGLRTCNREFRDFLCYCGVPYGRKSKLIKPPLYLEDLSIKDYIRGLYDGDGSIGLTADNFPFVSITTQSRSIRDFLINYISEKTGKPFKIVNKPKRDDVYNIMVTREDAVILAKDLYYKKCLSIQRKYKKAQKIKEWVRPKWMKTRGYLKRWTKEDDDYLLFHTLEESMKKLNRTFSGVQMRKLRLTLKNRKWR